MSAEPPPTQTNSLLQPFHLLLAGAGLMVVSLVVAPREELPVLLRVLPLLGGAALMFHALVVRLRTATWDAFPERVETAAFLAIAGGAAGANAFAGRVVEHLAPEGLALGIPGEWDAVQLFLGAAFLLLLSGTVVVLLPSLLRKVAISVWLVFHFAGMFVVFTSIDPPNTQGPWLAKQLWTVVYRPYLSFFYLTNAYHFYSPDPGPPALLWFAIQYEDGSHSWLKLPSRDKSPIGMHYQRLLALPEHVFAGTNRLAYTEAERQLFERWYEADPRVHNFRVHEDRVWDDRLKDGELKPGVYRRRYNASRKPLKGQTAFVYPVKGVPNGLVIPWVADMELLVQYREPTDTSRRLIAAVSRRVLREAGPNPEGSKPRTVKAYRIVHNCLTPKELADGTDPYSKNKYMAWYLGEFDRGDDENDEWPDHPLDTKDPFLYWYLPIVLVDEYPRGQQGTLFTLDPRLVAITARTKAPENGVLLNCLEMHATGDLLKWETIKNKKEARR